MSSRHIITRDIRVGNIEAETDNLLQECFIKNQASEEILDKEAHKYVLLGRTGAGKSAIIQHIKEEKGKRNVLVISLENMALNFLSNSNVIDYLKNYDVKLSLFFQAMWEHILITEYIRLIYDDSTNKKHKFRNFLEGIKKKNKTQKDALEYLEQYKDTFWVSVDENTRQWFSSQKEKMGISASLSSIVFDTESKNNKEEFIETKPRLKKFILPDQLSVLSKVIDALADEADNQDVYYILMDRLDENWVDENYKYYLINALFEAVKKLRRMESLRVIVALRSDVLEKAMQEGVSSGFQREKFDNKVTEIKWKDSLLKELINKRITAAYKKQYSPKQDVLFTDIFPEKINTTQDSFSYLLDRTLTRPRDIIAFVNMCLDEAEDIDSYALNAEQILAAERKYSEARYKALLDEWRNLYPSIEIVMSILKGQAEIFKLSDISDKNIEDFLVKLIGAKKDAIVDKAMELIEIKEPGRQKKEEFLKYVFSVLYHIGAVGIKFNQNGEAEYSHTHKPLADIEDITEDSSVYVAKMLYSFLNIQKKKKEIKAHCLGGRDKILPAYLLGT